MARYFDFDQLLQGNPETLPAYIRACNSVSPQKDGRASSKAENEEDTEASPIREQVFSILFFFATKIVDLKVSSNALIALGQIGAGCPSVS